MRIHQLALTCQALQQFASEFTGFPVDMISRNMHIAGEKSQSVDVWGNCQSYDYRNENSSQICSEQNETWISAGTGPLVVNPAKTRLQLESLSRNFQ